MLPELKVGTFIFPEIASGFFIFFLLDASKSLCTVFLPLLVGKFHPKDRLFVSLTFFVLNRNMEAI